MSDSVRLGIVSNTHSKGNRRHELAARLDRVVSDYNVSSRVSHGHVDAVRLAPGQKPSFEQLVDAYLAPLQTLVDSEGVNVLGINGGDGTAHLVFSALYHLYGSNPERMPALYHLRGGTINFIADSTGIPKRPAHRFFSDMVTGRLAAEYALEQLILGIQDFNLDDLASHTQRFHLLKTEDLHADTDDPYARYGILTSAGVIVNFLEKYYSKDEAFEEGPARAFAIIAKGIGSLVASGFRPKEGSYVHDIVKTQSMHVTLDGDELDYPEYSTLIATAKDLMFHIPPIPFTLTSGVDAAYQANQNYSAFKALGVSRGPFGLLGAAGLLALRQTLLEDERTHNRKAQRLVLTPQNSTDRILYTCEGEMYAAGQLQITPSENSVPFLYLR